MFVEGPHRPIGFVKIGAWQQTSHSYLFQYPETLDIWPFCGNKFIDNVGQSRWIGHRSFASTRELHDSSDWSRSDSETMLTPDSEPVDDLNVSGGAVPSSVGICSPNEPTNARRSENYVNVGYEWGGGSTYLYPSPSLLLTLQLHHKRKLL